MVLVLYKRGCTFIFKLIGLLITFCFFYHPQAFAAADPSQAPAIPSGKKDDPGLFDTSSPYLEYGEFNESEEEDKDTLFFQYGRFFGVSVGAGYQSATGNRGKVYSPAFPRIDVKVHYWFDFQLAMNMGIFFANHTFTNPLTTNVSKVALVGFGVDLKYYFDVRNMSAALTFANPFIIGGVGAMSKTETTSTGTAPDQDSSLSMNLGAGLEFPIVYKKSYFILEGRYHTQSFRDSSEDSFGDSSGRGVPDLSGGFVTLMAHILFTW